MNRLITKVLLCAAIALVILVNGCKRSSSSAPPPPLAVEQIIPEMRKVFIKAKSDVLEVIAKLDTALQQKDYPGAYQDVQFLCNLPEASEEQRLLAARASLTIWGLLQSASAQGDQNSAAMIDYRKRTR